MKFQLSVPVAIIFGVLTLLGYFIPVAFFQLQLQPFLIHWAIFIGVIALILGVFNLMQVHWRRAFSSKAGWGYSLILVLSLLLTFVVVLYFEFPNPASEPVLWVVRYLQIPLEASLSAVVAFVLLAAGARLLFRRRNMMSLIFLGTALLVILAAIPWPPLPVKELEDVKQALLSIPSILASGGGRGILIGMSLGAAATGLRVIFGIDRPYKR